MLREDRQLFNAADKNIDGRLDEQEFLAFTHPEEHPDMLPIVLQQTLDEKDINKDGVIDFQEYIGDKGKFLYVGWDVKVDKNYSRNVAVGHRISLSYLSLGSGERVFHFHFQKGLGEYLFCQLGIALFHKCPLGPLWASLDCGSNTE